MAAEWHLDVQSPQIDALRAEAAAYHAAVQVAKSSLNVSVFLHDTKFLLLPPQTQRALVETKRVQLAHEASQRQQLARAHEEVPWPNDS